MAKQSSPSRKQPSPAADKVINLIQAADELVLNVTENVHKVTAAAIALKKEIQQLTANGGSDEQQNGKG